MSTVQKDRMSSETARELCSVLGDHAFSAHRGAFTINGLHVVFGNDVGQDDRGIREAKILRQKFIDHWIIDDESQRYEYFLIAADSTWVFLLDCPETDAEKLTQLVWEAWVEVNGGNRSKDFEIFESLQRQIALEAIRDAMPIIRSVMCH